MDTSVDIRIPVTILTGGGMDVLGCLWKVEKSFQRGFVDFGSGLTTIAWITQDGLLFVTTNTLDHVS